MKEQHIADRMKTTSLTGLPGSPLSPFSPAEPAVPCSGWHRKSHCYGISHSNTLVIHTVYSCMIPPFSEYALKLNVRKSVCRGNAIGPAEATTDTPPQRPNTVTALVEKLRQRISKCFGCSAAGLGIVGFLYYLCLELSTFCNL